VVVFHPVTGKAQQLEPQYFANMPVSGGAKEVSAEQEQGQL